MEQPYVDQLVAISQTYTAEVDIPADYRQPEINAQKVQGYIPTSPAQQALVSIFQGLMPLSDKRVHLITGQYGTGKSHFGLLLANLFGRMPGDPVLAPFEDKLRLRDSQAARDMETRRAALPGRFLVVLIQPTTDPEGFNHSLLVTLKEAFDREAIPYQLRTRFGPTADLVLRWTNDVEIRPRLERELAKEHTDPRRLELKLRAFDSDAYDLFRRVYRTIVHDEFHPEYSGAPKEVFLEAARYLRREREMAGIIVIADEFGSYLREIARDPTGRASEDIQDFVQFCKRSREDQVHLVLIAHRTLADYAAGYRSRDEFTKLAGRFLGNEYSLTMAGGQTETIKMIDSVIRPRKDTATRVELWSHVERALQPIQDWAETAQLFPGQSKTWVREQLVNGCYPLHPAATYCLPWLSQRVGQANRTTFKFLDSLESGGLRDFVEHCRVEDGSSGLNLYTPDHFLAYFESGINERAECRPILQARQDALSISPRIPLAIRLIDTIAVLEIVHQPGLPRTRAVLAAIVGRTAAEATEAGAILDLLVQQRVIRYREANGSYELRRRASGEIDVTEAIQIVKDTQARTANQAVFELLKNRKPAKDITSREYETRYGLARTAAVEFVTSQHLSNLEPYLRRIQTWYQPKRSPYQGDVLVLLLFAESVSEIETARVHLANGTGSLQLVIAVPRQPFGGGEALLDLAAIEQIRRQSLKVQDSPVDPDDIDRAEEDRASEVDREWQQYRSSDNFAWYYGTNVNTSVPSGGEDKLISDILDSVFPKTPRINDESLTTLVGGRKERKPDRLKALEQILNTTGPLILPKSGGQPDVRMLRTALRDTELLEKKGDFGQAEAFEVREKAPTGSVLYEIWSYLQTQLRTRDRPVGLGPVVRELMAPPYGLTTPLLELLFAGVLRTVKDQVAIFDNVAASGSARQGQLRRQEIAAANISKFITNADDSVVIFYEIDNVQRQYIEGLCNLLLYSGGAAQPGGPWDRGKEALVQWLRHLPNAARDSIDMSAPARDFVQWLGGQNLPDGRQMLVVELPRRLGVSTGSNWTTETTTFVLNAIIPIIDELRDIAPRRSRSAQEKLCKIFEARGVTITDLDEATRLWFSRLQQAQRTKGYGGETRPLMEAIDSSNDPQRRYLVELPMALMDSCYETWTSDRDVDLFAERVQRLKQYVETWTPLGSAPASPEAQTTTVSGTSSTSGRDTRPQPQNAGQSAKPTRRSDSDPTLLKTAQDELRSKLLGFHLTRDEQRQVLERLLKELVG